MWECGSPEEFEINVNMLNRLCFISILLSDSCGLDAFHVSPAGIQVFLLKDLRTALFLNASVSDLRGLDGISTDTNQSSSSLKIVFDAFHFTNAAIHCLIISYWINHKLFWNLIILILFLMKKGQTWILNMNSVFAPQRIVTGISLVFGRHFGTWVMWTLFPAIFRHNNRWIIRDNKLQF